jgi:cell division protein FtsZ
VIVGTVYDDHLEDQLRVTIVATGLGKPATKQASKPQLQTVVSQRTGTDGQGVEVDYDALEQPAVIRRRNRDATVEAMRQSGVEMLDIPAFLRKQAD